MTKFKRVKSADCASKQFITGWLGWDEQTGNRHQIVASTSRRTKPRPSHLHVAPIRQLSTPLKLYLFQLMA